jgi:hypothetical protein
MVKVNIRRKLKMIKKALAIGLIVLSLAGCTNRSVDENENINPNEGKNTTGGQTEETTDTLKD